MKQIVIAFIIGFLCSQVFVFADGQNYGPFANIIKWIQSIDMRVEAIEYKIGMCDILHDSK